MNSKNKWIDLGNLSEKLLREGIQYFGLGGAGVYTNNYLAKDVLKEYLRNRDKIVEDIPNTLISAIISPNKMYVAFHIPGRLPIIIEQKGEAINELYNEINRTKSQFKKII